jgi:hypothetical protein
MCRSVISSGGAGQWCGGAKPGSYMTARKAVGPVDSLPRTQPGSPPDSRVDGPGVQVFDIHSPPAGFLEFR